MVNNRRRTYNNKKEKVLFELYNTYFDGTVNSVIDTGLKLWDGTHNKWKIEVEYDKITANYTENITLFVVRPDFSPYSGTRIRKDRANNQNQDCSLNIGEGCTVISNEGNFTPSTNAYGFHLSINNTNNINNIIIIRNGQNIYYNYNDQTATLKITNPKTNNLNLLIGCDYKGTDNSTWRYYKGTIYKFVITEL